MQTISLKFSFYLICFDDDSNNPVRGSILDLIFKLNNNLNDEEFKIKYEQYKRNQEKLIDKYRLQKSIYYVLSKYDLNYIETLFSKIITDKTLLIITPITVLSGTDNIIKKLNP